MVGSIEPETIGKKNWTQPQNGQVLIFENIFPNLEMVDLPFYPKKIYTRTHQHWSLHECYILHAYQVRPKLNQRESA
jgi:hypothetical protein